MGIVSPVVTKPLGADTELGELGQRARTVCFDETAGHATYNENNDLLIKAPATVAAGVYMMLYIFNGF